MKREPILVGLQDGRITHLSADTSMFERLLFIEHGCDTVILLPKNSEVPSFDATYKVELAEVK